MSNNLYVVNPEALEMYEAGKTIMEIAEHFDCHYQTARTALLRGGVEMRGRGRRNGTPNDDTEHKLRIIKSMRAAGATYRDIGKEIGRTGQAVHQLAQAHGI